VKCVRTSSPTARTSAMADLYQREKSPIGSDSESLVVVGVVSNGFRRMARAWSAGASQTAATGAAGASTAGSIRDQRHRALRHVGVDLLEPQRHRRRLVPPRVVDVGAVEVGAALEDAQARDAADWRAERHAHHLLALVLDDHDLEGLARRGAAEEEPVAHPRDAARDLVEGGDGRDDAARRLRRNWHDHRLVLGRQQAKQVLRRGLLGAGREDGLVVDLVQAAAEEVEKMSGSEVTRSGEWTTVTFVSKSEK
jgi:hypothetical protein